MGCTKAKPTRNSTNHWSPHSSVRQKYLISEDELQHIHPEHKAAYPVLLNVGQQLAWEQLQSMFNVSGKSQRKK